MRHDLLGQKELVLEIYVHRPVPIGFIDLGRKFAVIIGSIVDQHAHRTKRRVCLCNTFNHGLGVCQITGQEYTAGKGSGKRLPFGFLDVDERNLGTLSVGSPYNFSTNAVCAA